MNTKVMRIGKKVVSNVVALALVFAVVSTMAFSAFAAGASISPDSDAVLSENGSAKISFVADESFTIAGAKVVVAYDATALTPNSVSMGSSFGGLMVNNVDSAAGELVIVFAQADDVAYAAGDVVFTVTFSVLAAETEQTDVSVSVEEAANAALEDVSLADSAVVTYTVTEEVKQIVLDDEADLGDVSLEREDGASEATLTNISPSYSLADLISMLFANGQDLTVVSASGDEIEYTNTTAAATGDEVQLVVGGVVVDTVVLIVNGDVNGDASVNVSDMVAVQRNFLGLDSESPLEGIYKEAALLSGGDSVNVADMVLIQRYFLGAVDEL